MLPVLGTCFIVSLLLPSDKVLLFFIFVCIALPTAYDIFYFHIKGQLYFIELLWVVVLLNYAFNFLLRKKKLYINLITILLSLFFIDLLFVFIFKDILQGNSLPTTIFYIRRLSFILIVYFLFEVIDDDLAKARHLLRIIIYGAIVYSSLIIFIQIIGLQSPISKLLFGNEFRLDFPNTTYVFFTLPFGLDGFFSKNKKFRRLCIILFFSSLGAFIFSLRRSLYVLMPFVLLGVVSIRFFFTPFERYIRALAKIFVLTIPAVLVGVIIFFNTSTGAWFYNVLGARMNTFKIVQYDPSLRGRDMQKMKSQQKLMERNLLFGYGIGAFWNIRGRGLRTFVDNLYYNLLIKMGLAGTLLFMSFFFVAFARAIQLIKYFSSINYDIFKTLILNYVVVFFPFLVFNYFSIHTMRAPPMMVATFSFVVIIEVLYQNKGKLVSPLA